MFEVILKTKKASAKNKDWKWEFDDESEVEWDSPSARVMLVCQRLQTFNILEFVVSGFGPEPWDLEISYDLSMIMENLDDFLAWIDQGGAGVFQEFFYAYGAARTLFFTVIDGRVHIECISHEPAFFMPDPKIEISDLGTLNEMFTRLLKTFVSEVLHYYPEEAEDQYFKEWMQAPSIKARLEVQ